MQRVLHVKEMIVSLAVVRNDENQLHYLLVCCLHQNVENSVEVDDSLLIYNANQAH